MDIYQTQAQILKILIHPTRLAILDELRGGEQCVCHMEAKFGLRQAYISQHLMVLRDAGLVTDRRDGWNIFYSVSKTEIYQVIDAMRSFIDPESSLHAGNSDTSTRSGAKKRPCPCPKCNSQNESAKQDELDLVVNQIQTAI
jgi:ArsR family transcriptional regulator